MIDVFKQMSQGVYIIGVRDGFKRNAFTAAWVMQVSFVPPLIAFSINPRHYSYTLLQESGICSINILGREQLKVAEHFGSSGIIDKMAGFNWQQDKTGAPILSDCLAYLDCTVNHYSEAGDHKLVICNVVAAKIIHSGHPLLYSQTEDMDGSSELYK
ncbi:MAG: flavin reductase family protein [Methylococcaceae bacterium]